MEKGRRETEGIKARRIKGMRTEQVKKQKTGNRRLSVVKLDFAGFLDLKKSRNLLIPQSKKNTEVQQLICTVVILQI